MFFSGSSPRSWRAASASDLEFARPYSTDRKCPALAVLELHGAGAQVIFPRPSLDLEGILERIIASIQSNELPELVPNQEAAS